MDKKTKSRMMRMQKYLSTLRMLAGWSAEALADELDVTRQTIVNLEKDQTKITKIQYLVLSVIFYNKAKQDENKTLRQALKFLIDSPEEKEQERAKLCQEVENAVNKLGRRTGSKRAAIVAAATIVELFGVDLDAVSTESTDTFISHLLSSKESDNNL